MSDSKPNEIPLNMILRAEWVKPDKVEDFKYPHLSADIGPSTQDGRYFKDGQFAINYRTLGYHDPADTLLSLYNCCIHPRLRPFVERTLWDALHAIQISPEYQEAHDAWRSWKGKQPPSEQGRIMGKASGITTV